MMVFDEWQNGILIAFIVIGIARENNLHHVLHALFQHLLEGWMPNAIIVDDAQAKFFFFRYVDLLIEHVFMMAMQFVCPLEPAFKMFLVA